MGRGQRGDPALPVPLPNRIPAMYRNPHPHPHPRQSKGRNPLGLLPYATFHIPDMLRPRGWQAMLTIEPPGVVLISAHGRLLSKRAEDGCVRAHEVDVHASVELLICGGAGGSVKRTALC